MRSVILRTPWIKLILMMIVSFSFAALVIFFLYDDPLKGLNNFFVKPLTNFLFLGNLLNRSTLYILSGAAIVLAFQGGEFNLGGEGQVCIGGMVTLAFLLKFTNLPGPVGIILAIVLSSLAGGAMGSLSGFLKNKFAISEVISTYLLSMGFIQLSRYLISGPLKDRSSFLITTPGIEKKFYLKEIFPPSHLNNSLFLALILIVFIYLFLYYRPAGYDWRLCGVNRGFAAYCGINVKKKSIEILFVSGFLNGLTGAVAILGTYHMGLLDFFSGIGWNGMAVSLIGGNNPLLVIPSALFFSHLVQGSELLTLLGRFPYPLDGFIMALVFLFVTVGRLKND